MNSNRRFGLGDVRWLPVLLAIAALLAAAPVRAEIEAAPAAADARQQEMIDTLNSLISLQAQMKQDMTELSRALQEATTERDRKNIQAQIDKLEANLVATTRNLVKIAAGADIASLRETEERQFSLQEELFALLRPALDEMKEMTSHVRQKSELKEKIAGYREKLPVAENAVTNLAGLLEDVENESLQLYLQGLLADWKKQLTFIQSELQSAEYQLNKLEESEATLAEASQSYLKSFFQKRGLYLMMALLVVGVVLLVSRLTYRAIVRLVPGYRAEHRSFRLRLLDLMHRMVTILFAVAGPMIVFYVVEDWVLFSLGILLLLGIGLTLRTALPRYWHQIQLFLNVGSVREGERIFLDGLPWLVKRINFYSELENPSAEIRQRVPIDDLVELKSRPFKKDDPWFPCLRGDWVLLSDGMRGKVTGISQELVQLVARGGAHRTYQTADFMALSPVNLSRNFRLKEIIGISYDLQRESVTTIPDLLKAHVEKRAAEEGYAERMLNLRVEFAQANTSSLDLVVIADFDGTLADLYNRLRRCMQRWCVEACNEHGWEIPFTQLTLHQAVPEGA